jgi:hypothetical protein
MSATHQASAGKKAPKGGVQQPREPDKPTKRKEQPSAPAGPVKRMKYEVIADMPFCIARRPHLCLPSSGRHLDTAGRNRKISPAQGNEIIREEQPESGQATPIWQAMKPIHAGSLPPIFTPGTLRLITSWSELGA